MCSLICGRPLCVLISLPLVLLPGIVVFDLCSNGLLAALLATTYVEFLWSLCFFFLYVYVYDVYDGYALC